jgi:predicted phage gp36 major capsid-like protein
MPAMEGGFLTAAEFREVMRESTLRFERAMRALAAEIRRDVDAHREESRRYFEAINRKLDEEARRTDDIIAENRAQRAALFRVLDRLDGGGAEPAT